MNKDTVIGIGVGMLIGWLLWRKRGGGLMLMGAGVPSGGAAGCGCSGGGHAVTTSTPCAQRFSAGLGNYAQGNGPLTQGGV